VSRLALTLAAILYAIAAVSSGVSGPMRIVLGSYAVANLALAYAS
jgi:hypothetical protein